MNENQLSLIVPIKIFDEDITLQDLVNFINMDKICKERLETNTFFLVVADKNDYSMFQMTDVTGSFMGFINEKNNIKAKRRAII